MTSSEIAWWSPLWKRATLMALFFGLIVYGFVTGGMFTVAISSFLAGSAFDQMFRNWPPKASLR